MKALASLADFAVNARVGDFPERVGDKLRLHLFDTIVAAMVGQTTEEGKAAARFINASGLDLMPGETLANTVPPSVRALHLSAVARCTEIDDIHMASCTTPGSVVVPTALAMAEWSRECSDDIFLAALLVGYEGMIRFGMAVDGPKILYKGVWPTCLVAGIGATLTAARFIGLSADETANALGAVISLAPVLEGRPVGPVASRWLKLGSTVQSGILAAFGARAGFRTDVDILDRTLSFKDSLTVDLSKIVTGLGKFCEFDNISIKPYCAAKQVTSAIYGFLDILARDDVAPEDIEKVTVRVPPAYAGMINIRGLPGGRMASIMSAPYQLALAAKYPRDLRDVARSVIHHEGDLSPFLEVVDVEADEGLEAAYPSAWPATVRVGTGSGIFERQIRNSKGDATDPFSWDEIAVKASEVGRCIPAGKGWDRLAEVCRRVGRAKRVSDVVGMVREIEKTIQH